MVEGSSVGDNSYSIAIVRKTAKGNLVNFISAEHNEVIKQILLVRKDGVIVLTIMVKLVTTWVINKTTLFHVSGFIIKR